MTRIGDTSEFLGQSGDGNLNLNVTNENLCLCLLAVNKVIIFEQGCGHRQKFKAAAEDSNQTDRRSEGYVTIQTVLSGKAFGK
jgi:hypothetical protein